MLKIDCANYKVEEIKRSFEQEIARLFLRLTNNLYYYDEEAISKEKKLISDNVTGMDRILQEIEIERKNEYEVTNDVLNDIIEVLKESYYQINECENVLEIDMNSIEDACFSVQNKMTGNMSYEDVYGSDKELSINYVLLLIFEQYPGVNISGTFTVDGSCYYDEITVSIKENALICTSSEGIDEEWEDED